MIMVMLFNGDTCCRLSDKLAQFGVVDSFIRALEQLSQPEALFGDWLVELLETVKADRVDKEAVGEHSFLVFISGPSFTLGYEITRYEYKIIRNNSCENLINLCLMF